MKNKICEEFREHICEYIDSALPQAEMEKFKAHIEQCESCQSLLNEISSLTSSLTETVVDIPPELHNSIINKIKYEKLRKRSANITKFVKIFSASTAAVFCLFCVLTFAKLSYVSRSDNAEGNSNFNCYGANKEVLSNDKNTETKASTGLNAMGREYEFKFEIISDTYTEDSIVGKWIDKDGVIFEFRENGEIVLIDTNAVEYNGEYEILPQNTISLTIENSVISMIYMFEDNKLQMSITGGSLPLER